MLSGHPDESLSLLAAAREVPRQPALLIDGREHSFASLVPPLERCLAFLRAQPLAQEPWPRVALLADNRVETALWLYALLELGVTAVLLHPRLVASERAALLADCRPALVLADGCGEPEEAPSGRLRSSTPRAPPGGPKARC
jgi:acyl-CoA synthetase (AMP-forming)/AMP-acid ligase II